MRELTSYLRAKQKLADKLGFYPEYDVEYSKEKWNFDCPFDYMGTLRFCWDNTDNEFEYSEEVILKSVVDDKYSVFHIFSCTGDEYLLVMQNSKMKPLDE